MTQEKKDFINTLIKLLIIIVFASLYCLGGAEFGPGKWIRRYIATSILVMGSYWYSRDWRTLVGFPLLILGTSLGYGSDNHIWKIVKRLYCGTILSLGSTSADWLNKRWLIASLLSIFIISGMVVLGVWNVTINARVEEAFIGVLIALPILSSRKR